MSKVKKIGIIYVEDEEPSTPEGDRRILAEFVNLIVKIGYRTMKEQEKTLELENSADTNTPKQN